MSLEFPDHDDVTLYSMEDIYTLLKASGITFRPSFDGDFVALAARGASFNLNVFGTFKLEAEQDTHERMWGLFTEWFGVGAFTPPRDLSKISRIPVLASVVEYP